MTSERDYVSPDAISSLENEEWNSSEKQVESAVDLDLVNKTQKMS